MEPAGGEALTTESACGTVTGTPPYMSPEQLLGREVVADAASPSGYKLEPGPFPGWAKPPEW